MNKPVQSLLLTIVLAAGAAGSALAAKPVELNQRQGINNTSQNRVTSARLEAMLVDKAVKRSLDGIGGRSSDDCSTQIGNQSGGGSLLDRGTPVIVVGDVINVCG